MVSELQHHGPANLSETPVLPMDILHFAKIALLQLPGVEVQEWT